MALINNSRIDNSRIESFHSNVVDAFKERDECLKVALQAIKDLQARVVALEIAYMEDKLLGTKDEQPTKQRED